MIKFTELNKKLKRDSEYIDNVLFDNYEGNKCTCHLTFKSLSDKSSAWNNHLIDHINNYLIICNAIFDWDSTSKNVIFRFIVELS